MTASPVSWRERLGETRRRRHTPSQRRRGLDCELGDFLLLGANVRYWHLADIHPEAGHVRSWGVKRSRADGGISTLV